MMKKNELRIIGAISIDLKDAHDALHRPKKEKRNQFQIFFTTFKEWCANGTVHGIRYFTEEKRHWIERIWWMIAVALSMACCVIGVMAIYYKWYYRPVIVSFDDKTTSVGLITFPAVTICSTQKYLINQVNISKIIQTFLEMENNPVIYKDLTPVELNHFDAVMNICTKELRNAEDGETITRTESIYNTLAKISPDIDSVIPFAAFCGNFVHLKPILTDEGLCFAFNMLNSRDIYTDEIAPELLTVEDNPDTAYWNRIDEMTESEMSQYSYPYHVFGAGIRNGLGVALTMMWDRTQQYCSNYAQGFRLSLHGPGELPRSFIHIPVEQDVYVSVKPTVIFTSNALRKHPPTRRSCFFQSERHLKFFKSYTQQNCELECLSNFTKAACKCVPYWMPRDKNTSVCMMFDSQCHVSAGDKFARNLLAKKCQCLSDCTSITYDVEISQAPFRYTEEDIALKKSLNQSSDEVTTKLFISFKQPYFIALNRSETYTLVDFIASCGGLFGLYMGMSVLSVFELIYYFTLRLCCTMRQRHSIQGNNSTWAKRNNLPLVKRQPKRKRY